MWRPSFRARVTPSPAVLAHSILLGAAIIMIYMLLGGFWTVSVTDTLQGTLMALSALLLPLAAYLKLAASAGWCRGYGR